MVLWEQLTSKSNLHSPMAELLIKYICVYVAMLYTVYIFEVFVHAM